MLGLHYPIYFPFYLFHFLLRRSFEVLASLLLTLLLLFLNSVKVSMSFHLIVHNTIIHTPILWHLIHLFWCFGFADFTGWTQAAVLPDGHRIDCEHFDEKNCTMEGDCAIKVEHCKVESEKTSSCYVLWTMDSDTGIYMYTFQYCYILQISQKNYIYVFVYICIYMIRFFYCR